MKNRFLTILILLTSINAFSINMIFEGKPYNAMPANAPTCGDEVSGPEYTAAKFAINLAQGLGEKTMEAACKAAQKNCAPDEIKKVGIEALFKTIREYPPRTKSAACRELRKDCENTCKSSKLFDEQDCLIECNQYETWNK